MTIKLTNPNPYGLLSQQRLKNFERSIKIRLPTDYRNFLLQYNGGNPVPSFFWIESKKDGSYAFEFYGLHDGPEHLSINTYKGKEHYGIPDSLIPIGDDGTGNFICLCISDPGYGEISFLDHEEHPYRDPNSIQGITKLSNNFSEFCDSLIESPE